MHIAMLAGEYPPLWGGLGSATYHLCNFLSNMGHEITVITRKLKNGIRPSIKNVNIIEVNWLYAPMAFTRSYGKNAIKALKKLNSENSIDIIHLHCPLIALKEKEILSLRENISPVITSLHGSWLGERDGIIAARTHKESAVWKNPNDLAILLTARYYSKFETAAAKASNICVANSEATKNDFCTRYSLSNQWNCEVIHWGIDESLFRPINHENDATVVNLSALFLKEFYKKTKKLLTPGLENVNFVNNLDVSNFIKNSKSLYQSKGTEESFRILFNVLYNETPKIVDLEKYLIKPSTAEFISCLLYTSDAADE